MPAIIQRMRHGRLDCRTQGQGRCRPPTFLPLSLPLSPLHGHIDASHAARQAKLQKPKGKGAFAPPPFPSPLLILPLSLRCQNAGPKGKGAPGAPIPLFYLSPSFCLSLSFSLSPSVSLSLSLSLSLSSLSNLSPPPTPSPLPLPPFLPLPLPPSPTLSCPSGFPISRLVISLPVPRTCVLQGESRRDGADESEEPASERHAQITSPPCTCPTPKATSPPSTGRPSPPSSPVSPSLPPPPRGGRLLVVRNGEPGVGGKEAGAVKLEVWGAGRLLREVHVPATVHGGVYADGWFEGVSWNEDETCVAYVAEEPAPPKPVFGQPRQPAATSAAQHPPAAPAGPARGRFGAAAAAAPAPVGGAGKGKNGAAEAGTWKGKGEWMEDWGERYAGEASASAVCSQHCQAFQEEEGGEDEGVGRETRGEAVASGVISQHCHVRKGGVVVNASGWISKLLFVGWSAFPLTVSHRLSPSVTTLYHSVPLCTALYPSLCLSQWHTAGGRGHSGGHQCGAGGVGADSGGAAAHAVLRRLVLLLLSLSLTFSYCSVPLCAALSPCSGTVQAVEGIPGDISAGQVVWAPAVEGQQHTLLFVGWSAFPSNFNTARRLGIVYCANRPCHLFAAQAPSQDPAGKKPGSGSSIVKLTAGISSAFSPRFSPDGSLLVFLSSHAAVDSGTHGATNSLHSLLWPKEGISFPHAPPADPEEDTRSGPSDVPAIDIPINSIISVVARAEEQGGFPGLYAAGAIANPWLADGRTLLLTTAWRSTQAIISVHVESGRVSRLTPEGPISWVLLDVRNNVVVAGASTPACPTKLMLGRVNAGWLKQEGWLWSEISPPHVEYADAVENALKSTEFEVIPIVPSVSKTQGLTEGAKQPFEAIFVRRQPEAAAAPPPAGSKVAPAPAAPAALPPLLVVPHGGPHGVSTTNFVMPYAYLCALGYAVLHVNYRGSLGFGEEALQSLPKHIGRQDVADVLEAIDRVVELGYVDASRMAVIGGSHGGFLAGHLIGQEPDRFRTAVLRNPVTNLASMVGTTDIPDWCFVEAFGQPGMAAFSDSPTAAELQTFLKASPITYASKVKVPTLFVLGGKDLRVPSSNGLQLVHALRAQGLEARVLMMPEDVHAIDKPQSEFEQWITVASWLKQHL
ncbi:unnamed protein product [Closterium sp. NIES-65]|nr:unnamed protein product [Closterium sp. NIES-65]